MRAVSLQRGVAGAALIVALVIVVAAALFSRWLSRTETGMQGAGETASKLERISNALVDYASLNRRLPCPAAGTDDLGNAAPLAPTIIAPCSSFDGVVPWHTLGLQREYSVDSWGRKISYRVPSNLTLGTALDAVNCHSHLPTVADPIGPGPACGSTPFHRNTQDQLVSALSPFLPVNDMGEPKANVAFVLISHGPTGRGSFPAESGTRSALPAIGIERANAQVGATFSLAAASTSIGPDEVGHFDDILVYKSYGEVVASAKLAARNWGLAAAGVGGGHEDVGQAAVRQARDSDGNLVVIDEESNTGETSIDFGSVLVESSSGRTISSVVGGSGQGLGAMIAGGPVGRQTLSSETSEFLRFTFDAPARKLGITLIDFGSGASGGLERVDLRFRLAGAPVETRTIVACRAMPAVQANYRLVVGGDFDSVEIDPRTTTSGGISAFLVGPIVSCLAAVDTNRCIGANAEPESDC